MSEAECENANWRLRGEDDGRAGYRRERVNDHTKACSEYGVQPDLETYAEGWKRGIEEFCTKESGWQFGLSGGTYEDSCPEAISHGFNQAYALGSRLYKQQSEISTLQTDLDLVNAELDDLEGDDKKRKKLKKKRKHLKKDLREAETELLLLRINADQQGYALP